MNQIPSSKNKTNGAIYILMALFGIVLTATIVLFTRLTTASALPGDLANAENTYPAMVGSQIDTCSLCHLGSPPALNAYGSDYLSHGRNAAAAAAIASLDSDGDGFTNLQEIQALTFPGDASDFPAADTSINASSPLDAYPPPGTTTVTSTSAAYPPPATSVPTQAPTATSTFTAIPPTATRTRTALPTRTPTNTTAPTQGSTATSVPTRTPTNTTVPTQEPTATSMPTQDPSSTAVPTQKPTSTSVPSQEPTSTPIPTQESSSTLAPTQRPSRTPVPTNASTATVDPTHKTTKTPATTLQSTKQRRHATRTPTVNVTRRPTRTVAVTRRPTHAPSATRAVSRTPDCRGKGQNDFRGGCQTPHPTRTLGPKPSSGFCDFNVEQDCKEFNQLLGGFNGVSFGNFDLFFVPLKQMAGTYAGGRGGK